MWKAFIGAFFGRIVAAILLACAVLLGFGPRQWLSWFFLGHELISPELARWAFLAIALISAVYVFAPVARWVQCRLRRPAWAERDRLELHAIVSLAAGQPIAAQVNVDPQLSWLRILKDAIGEGRLTAVYLDRRGPYAMTQVSREDARRFADLYGHSWLQRFVSRWESWAQPTGGVSVTTPPSGSQPLNEQRAATENSAIRYSVHFHGPGSYRLEIFNQSSSQHDAAEPSYIKFRPKAMELVASNNVCSVTDNGIGYLTVTFATPLDPTRIVVLPVGATPRAFRVIDAPGDSVTVAFDDPEPETIELRFEN